MKEFSTLYTDKFGTEQTDFQSNGSELRIKLRGIDFKGDCFESLEGEIDERKFEYVKFGEEDSKFGDLTNCRFYIEIPIKLIKKEEEITKLLQADIQIDQSKNYGINLTINSNPNPISNSKRFGYFEDALVEIQEQLPKDEKIKSCLSCKFSHYSPFGNGMFGDLYCFKKIKEKTSEIKDKISLFAVWELAHKEDKLFNVQETFDCDEHQFIESDDWNYSNWK